MTAATTGDRLVLDLHAAGRGDRAAFSRLFDSTWLTVDSWLRRVLPDVDGRNEFLLVVYKEAWLRAPQFRDGGDAGVIGWIGGIVRDVVGIAADGHR